MARALVNRAIEYCVVEKDLVRIESVNVLGWCVGGVCDGSKAAVSILKKKKKGKDEKSGRSGVNVDSDWKLECLIGASKAILPRLTDKIAKVRSAAIAASSTFFLPSGAKFIETSPDYAKLTDSIQSTLLWLISNDSSASNRALATTCIPTSEESIEYWIERVKDVEGKVRESALDVLRENVSEGNLSEDSMVEILRTGLTKR